MRQIRNLSKFGQVSVFAIIAIIIISGAVLYFILKGNVGGASVPASLEPVYNGFLNCLEESAKTGVNVLESQGGYIELPDFTPGSAYMPFSNLLNFLGNPIPYWYYISGNNIPREQVPTKSDMENSLGKFVEQRIIDCNYDGYYQEGFEIIKKEAKADVTINDNNILINLKMPFSISKEEDNALINTHRLIVNSNLGKLYNSALKIYKQEQATLFLENFGVDTLRLYAPVDGVELTCSPKIWNANSVFRNLSQAIEINTLALRGKNNDFKLTDEKNKYYAIDLGVNENVRFVNSKDWPISFEVAPSEGVAMISNPIGNQQGLGILGFCYVSYHFVYNVKYPVLVQVYSDNTDEIFQFPMAVVLQGNMARKPINVDFAQEPAQEFCVSKNSLIKLNVYDTNLNPVEADVSYSCFGSVCDIGKSSNGILEENFPQCVNGVILAKANGYLDARKTFSSVNSGEIEIILDRVYEKKVNLSLDGKAYNKEAIISFNSDKNSKTIIYPEQKTIELSEGQYEVRVYIYRNSSLKIAGVTKQQCIESPKPGLGGLLGLKEEKCFDLNIPEQIVSNALAGGGVQNSYILESDLSVNNNIQINAQNMPVPKSLEDLQDNYVIFEKQNLDILFV